MVIISMYITPIMAGEYTPPGLYDVQYYQFPNGLHVLLKERHEAKTVSFRVVVNTGTADYPCGRKETPHFLEHLLFTGTSKHNESELDDLIEEHGGSWNAGTYHDKTVYELDIFNKYSDLGLETLYEIITDSQITQNNVDISRGIIHRESGGRPSAFKQWFYKNGIGKVGGLLAREILLEGTPYVCQNLEMADDIKRSDILDAYHRYYIANNMTLIVVGDFKSAEMKTRIDSTFGVMKSGKPYLRQISHPNPNEKELLLTSTFSPILDNEALVGVVYATVGTQSPDFYHMWFIERYLQDKLYKKIRVEEGKSYSPTVFVMGYSDVGVLAAIADTDLSAMDDVVNMIQHEIDILVQNPVSEEVFSLVKEKLLTSIVKGYESNTEIADYYTESISELNKHGVLTKVEEKINTLSVSEIQRVAKKYLGAAPRLVFHNTPTMTYLQFGLILAAILLFVIFLAIRFLHGRHK